MAYQNDIPKSTDALSQSQQDIQNNFFSIGQTFDVNHVDFNDGTNFGKHKYVELPQQSGTPPIPFPATEMVLYAAESPFNAAVNEIFINKTNQATLVQVPFTASILSVSSNPASNTAGWAYLPSGLLIKWGNGNANGNTVVVFPSAGDIPPFTEVLSMSLTTADVGAGDTNTFVRLSGFTNIGFTCYGSSRTTVAPANATFQYFAIGY